MKHAYYYRYNRGENLHFYIQIRFATNLTFRLRNSVIGTIKIQVEAMQEARFPSNHNSANRGGLS